MTPGHFPELYEACQPPLGLYLHVPLCKDRCTYCSFATTRNPAFRVPALVRLNKDVEAWGEALGKPGIDTLYLGGGTPSILALEELQALLSKVDAHFDLRDVQEATLEANPGTVDLPWLQGARHLGLDRLSLGIQTLDDGLLRRLGRIHSGADGLRVIKEARTAGFQRLSADLMVGLPGQVPESVLADAHRLVDAGVEHLSIYLLDLDKDCPLRREVQAGRLVLPDEDRVADVYEALHAFLPSLGLEAYEISNHARPGQESLHNSRYWLRRPYLGLGPSAASHLGRWRWSETADLAAWARGAEPEECQRLEDREDLAEIPLLGLRRQVGIDWSTLECLGAARGLQTQVQAWREALLPLEAAGLLETSGTQIRLTPKGMLLSNLVFRIFVE